jgi:hypothetical protein
MNAITLITSPMLSNRFKFFRIQCSASDPLDMLKEDVMDRFNSYLEGNDGYQVLFKQ